MMRAILVLSALAAVWNVAPALSQEAAVAQETRCWLGSVTFSSGSLMNTGTGVKTCVGDKGWIAEAESGDAAGCLLDGELSSVGAIVSVSNADQLWVRCETDGRWSQVVSDAGGQ
jgi:hypothetical protein